MLQVSTYFTSLQKQAEVDKQEVLKMENESLREHVQV